MIVLNLKTYSESTGSNLDRLLNAIRQLNEEYPDLKDKVIVAPSLADLYYAAKNYSDLNIASQHVDNINSGSSTGWVPVDIVLSYGVKYVIYNHSEHKIEKEKLIGNIKVFQEKGLKVIACCENTEEALSLIEANPFAIAYEPKDLIGSGISVTTRPEAVKSFLAQTLDKTNALIGAGVTTGEDVLSAKNLGAQGALLASAFVKASNPYDKLKELLAPYA